MQLFQEIGKPLSSKGLFHISRRTIVFVIRNTTFVKPDYLLDSLASGDTIVQDLSVLGTCATFSATAPLARTKKGGARRDGAEVKNNGAVAVARKKWR